jgi:hypothetical protein
LGIIEFMQHLGQGTRGLAAAAAAALAGAALLAAPSAAQSGEDLVSRCRSLLTDAERIACLEAAVLGSGVPAAAPAAAPATVPRAEPPPRRGFRLPAVPFIGGGDEPAPRTFSSDAPEAAELGAEQVATFDRAAGRAPPAEARPRMVASVVAVRQIPYKRLEVELENGQVWRQTSSDEAWNFARYDDPDSVEIWPSVTGGYRMHMPENNRTVVVERIR